MQPHAYCHYCGAHQSPAPFPKTCPECEETTWSNPTPVVILLVPMLMNGLSGINAVLAVRRDIEPAKGRLALPGGFIESGQTWREAAVRELQEETGLEMRPHRMKFHHIYSSVKSNTLLVFCTTPTINELPKFTPNEEVSELVTIHRDNVDDLVWPAHREAATDVILSGQGDLLGSPGLK